MVGNFLNRLKVDNAIGDNVLQYKALNKCLLSSGDEDSFEVSFIGSRVLAVSISSELTPWLIRLSIIFPDFT